MERIEPNDRIMINVNDVATEKQKEAEIELRDCFGPLARDLDIFIEVIVTGKFTEIVGKILSERCGVKIPYNAKHSEVVACGKTIPYKRENELAFVVIFDASVFGKWENEQNIHRLLTLSHEKIHVEDEKILCDDIGIDVFLFEPTIVEDIFFRLAHDVWMEYNAERHSVEIFMNTVKELYPDATANFNLHQGYVKSFISLLESLPDFLHKNIREFMNWKMTMDEFWPKMYLKVREVLVLAAFTSAHSDALGNINDYLLNMRQNKSCPFFFDTWKSVESDLRTIYETDRRYDKSILTNIANKLRELYERCGMTLSDTQSGVFVTVNQLTSDIR